MVVKKEKIKEVKLIGKNDDYVYDISINDENPYFFANNILVHNSVYFSVDTAIKNNKKIEEKFKDFEINKDNIIKYYDEIAEKVNSSFTEFLKKNFNINESFSSIRAGRELVASSGFFVTKKRYAVLMYDKEGVRLDKNGSHGKIKAMGLDLKRSDTPEIVQKFLEEILFDVLLEKTKDEIFTKIREFKDYFRNLKPWEKGIPKRVNGLTDYTERFKKVKQTFSTEEFYNVKKISSKNSMEEYDKNILDKNKKKNVFAVPGHVMASINYNRLRNIFNDTESMEIQDGSKIIVCYLKNNQFNMTSVAYPIDLAKLPDWFKSLPFDEEEMETTVLDKKIENLLEIFDWDLDSLKNNNNYDDFFSF